MCDQSVKFAKKVGASTRNWETFCKFAAETLFGSYSKGYANPDSDIDVAVVVPTYGDRKQEMSKGLWRDVRNVSFLIEPVLMAEDRWSPLYDDVMRTGINV